MARKFKTGGYVITVSEGIYREDDGSFGEVGGSYQLKNGERRAWAASISNGFYHVTSLHPFDSENAAIKGAQRWVKEHKNA